MSSFIDRIKLYTDGGCRGNPGPGAIAYIILDQDNNELDFCSECIGETTNNRAEYTALIRGLDCAARYTTGTVYCFLDSKLVINQRQRIWRTKKDELRPLLHQVLNNERLFENVVYQHLPNTNPMIRRVDRLVKQVMEGR